MIISVAWLSLAFRRGELSVNGLLRVAAFILNCTAIGK